MIKTKESSKEQAEFLSNSTSNGLAIYLRADPSLLPYLIWSCTCFVLFIGCLFFSKRLMPPPEDSHTKQFIDIELVSQADFQNKKNILPSTKPKPSVGKRISPIDHYYIVIPRTPVVRGQVELEKNKLAQTKVRYIISCQRRNYTNTFESVARLPVISRSVTTNSPQREVNQSSAELDLEEVKPLELTEIKDNDGDNSIELWQDGGHTNQGLGAASTLTNYLNELHKKLKRSWSPPPGPVHHIKVLFRLTSDGSIISLKLIASSGDDASDNSALQAVRKAAPFGKLPKDYPCHFLDLAYTFNYSTDELHEIPNELQ